MKKVLIIIPHLGLGGAETMCENLSYQLKNNDINVEIVSFYNKETDITKRIEKNGIKIHYLNKKKGPDLFMLFRLIKLIKRERPDVIHTHLYVLSYVVPALKILRTKNKIRIVHTVHNIASKEVNPKIQKIQRKCFKNKTVIPVAISELIQDSICDLYNLEKNDVPIVYNGINLKKCIEKNNYNSFNKILHVGRFFEQKNHFYILKIFEKLLKENDKYHLYLVGDGELKSAVEKYVSSNKIQNVHFVGSIPDSYSIMNESDLFILPSKWEGFPMTIIEALGTGLPVIASNVGGIPNMIDNEINGFIADDIDEYIDIIKKLENDQNLREKIGNKAKKQALKFSSQKMAKDYINIYFSR